MAKATHAVVDEQVETTDNPRVRVQFEMTKEKLEELDRLRERASFESRRDLFNAAFELLEWAVDESAKGRDIASVDEDSSSYRTFGVPTLLRLKRAAKARLRGAVTALRPATLST